MCKAPKIEAPKTNPSDPNNKPEYLRNPYLDSALGGALGKNNQRAGRNSLKIDLTPSLGIGAMTEAPTGVPQVTDATRSSASGSANLARYGGLPGINVGDINLR